VTGVQTCALPILFIPKPFFAQMSSTRFVHVVVPFKERVNRLVETYAGGETELLIAAISRIERRLGSQSANQAKKYIGERHMEKAVEIVLEYYDKVYARSMGMQKRAEVNNIFVKDEDSSEIANIILEKINP
jgi:hypothetical protein